MWPTWAGAIIYHRGGYRFQTYRERETLNTLCFALERNESYMFVPSITYEEAGNDRNYKISWDPLA
jgi:hypothetical protein